MACNGAAPMMALLLVLAAGAILADDAAVDCDTVATDVADCLAFAQDGGTPSEACCSGLSALNEQAATTPDRQAVCDCLKRLTAGFTGLNADNVAALPAMCGVNVPYAIRQSTDCSQIR